MIYDFNLLTLITSPPSQSGRNLRKHTNYHRHKFLYGRKGYRYTGKELDAETGLYYYGARYLDPRVSRWLSGDPAMWQGDYLPSAPVNDEARRRNGNLPGQGGIFNYVNLHVYHYGGNNPVKYIDPDGKFIVRKVIRRIVVTAVAVELITGRQVSGSISDFADEYNNMRTENIINNDHYHHGMANSRATQRGPLGKITAQALSFVREAVDTFRGDTKRDIREDNIANRHGRDINHGDSPNEHNAIFDTRQGGTRAELHNLGDERPRNVIDFLDTYFTRDNLNE